MIEDRRVTWIDDCRQRQLEPRVLDNKYYAPGVGVVFERSVKGPKGSSASST